MAAVTDDTRPLKQTILLLIGFCFALLGFLNAVPDFGPLPSLGVIRAGRKVRAAGMQRNSFS